MPEGLAASDVIRSMMREGFSHDEIYDVLAGTGLPGEQVQLLIDRVASEFHGVGIEPQPSRLAAEVTRVFYGAFEELQRAAQNRMDSFGYQLELLKIEIEKLSARVLELGLAMNRARGSKNRGKHLVMKSRR